MTDMTQKLYKVAWAVVINAILAASLLLFATGFFPHKAFLPGLATWADIAEASTISPPFDKVIFMVVDALRSDFVYSNSSNFHFTQSLIRSGAAIPFTGHASPPTITMPRVKAITTGSVPSFVDLVLNFDESDTSSTLAAQDSWLAQLRAKPGSNLVMLGDDTWLRLFPDFFYRSDGTTSFFVSDFTEVDNNVTRHVPEELAKDDWSGLILHYLGLDHIGHKTGPRGPNMPAKQREMDGIVRQIYEAMDKYKHLQSSLLILLGDHGMNEGGGHGANSAGEVSTALAFISPTFKKTFEGQACPAPEAADYRYYNEVEQSDLAPTLAALLGFPIPRNNLGGVIPQLLELWPMENDRLQILMRNAQQIKGVAVATYPEAFASIDDGKFCLGDTTASDAEALACQWFHLQNLEERVQGSDLNTEMCLAEVQSFLKNAQSLLSGAASKYDLPKMFSGAALAGLALLLSIATSWESLRGSVFDGFTFFAVLAVYGATMFASSYVEEEQQFWYWITGAWFMSLAWKANRFESKSQALSMAGIGSYLLFGLVRRWNQTGQKYAGEPDLVTEILAAHPVVLWNLVLATYGTIALRLRERWIEAGLQVGVLPVLVVASAFLFKIAFTAADAPELLQDVSIFNPLVGFAARYSLIHLARVVFLGLATLIGASIYYGRPWTSTQRRVSFLRSLLDVLELFLVTQTKTVNIPLFLAFYTQAKLLEWSRGLQPLEISITSLLMQYSSFFAFKGTNAISSVDLSNAYNGIGGFNVVAVGVLTFVSNWAGPIWWSTATLYLLQTKIPAGQQKHFNHFGVQTVFASLHVLAVMVACTVLREHLFIWTVFSPKYLYTVAWVLGQHMVVNGIFGGLITAGGAIHSA